MARFATLLFGGGAIVTVVGLILPHEAAVDETGLAAVAAVAGLLAVALRIKGDSLPAWTYWLVAAAGTAFVSLALLFNGERSGGPAGGDEMYYLWVVLYAAYFFRPLATAAQVVVIAGAYAATLVAIDPGSIAVSRWISTIGLMIGSALVVQLLSDRIERLVTLKGVKTRFQRRIGVLTPFRLRSASWPRVLAIPRRSPQLASARCLDRHARLHRAADRRLEDEVEPADGARNAEAKPAFRAQARLQQAGS
jgi:hypothetical protein